LNSFFVNENSIKIFKILLVSERGHLILVIISVWATLILVAISDHVTLLFLGFFFKKKQGVCHVVPLPFTLKSILRQKKKNYGNSNISPYAKL
jgi:hypothetical protein